MSATPFKMIGTATLAVFVAAAAAASPVAKTTGEIKKIDAEHHKLTIAHGIMTELFMPPMTMVFNVVEPAMMDGLSVGDNVTFTATLVGGTVLTIVDIQKQP